ncbi:hypothetical protein E3E26_04275 [Thermococcus sp. LS1]|uniref:hypothetical protein n=1 Tax=Thermococcus sp. LS1 TaxID=1638259 RepID=UPI001438A7AB|nr:hypothetical protein [Thermococcus sp. LS1]NJD99003.1 hypothetical protein [Thermococcus sp. LS1]
MTGVSVDKIRELILSWQMRDAVKLSRDSEEVLLALIELISEEDRITKIRALSALGEVLKGADKKTKSLILGNGFDAIVGTLREGDERLKVRALRVLKRLLEGNPLTKNQLAKLVDALASLVSDNDGLAWLEAVELTGNISTTYSIDGVLSRIDPLLTSPNLREKALGIRLLLALGGPSEENWGSIVSGIAELLRSKDPLLVEVGLDSAADMLNLPIALPMERIIENILPALKEFTKSADTLVLRAKAREVIGLLEGALYNYYRSRPIEARNAVRKFLSAGFVDEAMMLSLVVGDSSLLLGTSSGMGSFSVPGQRFDEMP